MGQAKMAGSVGNVVNVSDALKHMAGDAIRFFVLGTHYRSPIDMGEWEPGKPLPAGMLAAKAAHDTFLRFAERVGRATGTAFAALTPAARIDARSTSTVAYAGFLHRFHEHMDDDFNTGGAVAVLFDLVNRLNKLADEGKLEDPSAADPISQVDFAEGAQVVRDLAAILGLTFDLPKADLGGGDELVAGLMRLLLDLRDNLRTQAKSAAKENPLRQALFGQTDLIRTRLAQLGVTLEDRAGGTTWRVG
jgi:cysteinyl-tRNA synthetase